jgi:hypothetical protein
VTHTVTGSGNLSILNAMTAAWSPTGQDYTILNLAPGGVLVGLTSVVSDAADSHEHTMHELNSSRGGTNRSTLNLTTVNLRATTP